MRKVVVNSTPLIVLAGIGQLELLHSLYQEIHIPKAVYKEITAKNDSLAMKISQGIQWIKVESIEDHSEKKMFRAKLHDGEVEVMILSQEKNADLIVMDDNAAKKQRNILALR